MWRIDQRFGGSISGGESDKRTTYNIGSYQTGKSVVSATFAWVARGRTYLVLSWHKGWYDYLGGDLWLVLYDWHIGVTGESNDTIMLERGEGGSLWTSVREEDNEWPRT